MKCDTCGRFTHHLNDVWDSVARQIDREVCDDCYRITRRDRRPR